MMAGARVTTMAVVVAAWLCAPAAMGQSARAPIPPHDGALQTLHWFDDLEAEQHEALTQEASVAAMAVQIHRLDQLHEQHKDEQPGFLAAQLLHYGVRSENELAWYVFAIVIQRTRIRADELVAGAAPFLLSDDRREQGVANHLLELAATKDGNPPDLDAFIYSIDGNPALIRWMYEFAPGHAMIAIGKSMRYEAPKGELRSLIFAEHVIADTIWKQQRLFLPEDQVEPEAAERLALLAASESWYARLYAAEIMRQHRGFRDDGLITRLARDGHALVREVAEAIGAAE